jgi:hypothetical protein
MDAHVSASILEEVRAGRAVARKAAAHIDGCLACRRALGISAARLEQPANRAFPDRVALVGALALVLAVIAIAPLRSVAFGFVEIFEPRTIAFVPMTATELADMRAVPDLSAIGETREITQTRNADAGDVLGASRLAGYRLREPAPQGVYAARIFHVVSPGIQELTLSAAKARASSAARGATWSSMPAAMDGATLRVAFGPIVTAVYGPAGITAPVRRAAVSGPAPRQHVVYFGRGGDAVVIAQMPVPRIGTNGSVSIGSIEQYVLSQPGVPPRLAAAFAALRDPTTTLPIPIPMDRSYATPVFVDGVWGMALGDNTGLGAVVVWQRNGFLYGVAGSRSERDILAIANSLR